MKNLAMKGGVGWFYKEIYSTAGFAAGISIATDKLSRPKGLSARGAVSNPAANERFGFLKFSFAAGLAVFQFSSPPCCPISAHFTRQHPIREAGLRAVAF
jgi:hypothetical protein